MLAKGLLLCIKFETQVDDHLYIEVSEEAIRLADLLPSAFLEKGYPMLVENRTNQIFPIIPDAVLEKLGEKYGYCYQERVDETHSAVRFCTSWATLEENVDELIEDLKNF